MEGCTLGTSSTHAPSAPPSLHAGRNGGGNISGFSLGVDESGKDVQQRAPGDGPDQPSRHARYQQHQPTSQSLAAKGLLKHLGAPGAIAEEEDVCPPRDTSTRGLQGSQGPRAPAAVRRRSAKPDVRRKSVAPHALGASW